MPAELALSLLHAPELCSLALTMTCVLRISGKELDLEAVIGLISLSPYRTWIKGEPRSTRSKGERLNTDTGVAYDVSHAEMTQFEKQVSDATKFLLNHRSELSSVSLLPATESVNLDFGIELGSEFIHSDFLNSPFLKAAADAGVSVELSHYPSCDETDEC